jgi:hypothetical protein
MSAIAVAIIGSAIIGVGGSYMAGEAQKEAADKAVKSQEKISKENIDLQRELTQQQREDVEPWRVAGEGALQSLQAGIESGEFDMGDSKIDVNLEDDPGYRFRLSEGVNALDASASARGRLLSGAQAKGVNEYAQNVASNEYGAAYARGADEYARESNRKLRKFNALSSLAGTGQVAATDQANRTSALASNTGNIMNNLGQAQAQGEYNKGNARAGAYQGGAQSINQAAQNWLIYKNLNTAPAVAPAAGA